MKLSQGVQIGLGIGALVILYLVLKKSGTAAAPAAQDAAANPVYQFISPGSPITGAGLTVNVQPPLIPLNIQMN